MNIIEDYKNWKDEHIDLIDNLLNIKSKIISRFTHVIAVCEYISTLSDDLLNEDLENIFEVAFTYLSRQIETIETLFEKDYRHNLNAFDKASRSINLLLQIEDYISEYENLETYDSSKADELSKLEDDVLEFAENGKDIDDIHFGILNDLVYKLFPEDYRTINDILYDVAIELNLIDSYEDDDLDIIFGAKEPVNNN